MCVKQASDLPRKDHISLRKNANFLKEWKPSYRIDAGTYSANAIYCGKIFEWIDVSEVNDHSHFDRTHARTIVCICCAFSSTHTVQIRRPAEIKQKKLNSSLCAKGKKVYASCGSIAIQSIIEHRIDLNPNSDRTKSTSNDYDNNGRQWRARPTTLRPFCGMCAIK